MPKIQEYSEQIDTPGPQGSTSPDLVAIGSAGEALKQFGNTLYQTSEVNYRRQEQAETSDIYATMADKRAELLEDVNQKVNSGTFDADKFHQDYQDWVQDQSGNYQTASGKNYFNRQAARLQGTLLTRAARGQALQQANDAKAKFQEGVNSNSATIEDDPEQFQDLLDGNKEHLGQLTSQGLVPAKDAPKFQEAIGTQLAQSALRGYINQDPDKAEEVLKSGKFDSYLNASQRKTMEGEIRQAQNAAEIESTRQDNIAKKAQAAQAESWGQQAMPKLVNNQLSTKEILASPLTVMQKHEWLGWVKEQAKMQTKTDPQIYNDVERRIMLPSNSPEHISDPSQILSIKGVSPQDLPKLNKFFDKSPDGQVILNNRKMMIQSARAALVNANPIMGLKDPNGEYNLMQFSNALSHEEQNLRNAGKPVGDLYNPNSPNYFGHRIQQYQRSSQEILKSVADQSRSQAAGAPPTPPPANIYTSPGITPVNEVKRKTKDGQTAVYDSNTKKFLRYEK